MVTPPGTAPCLSFPTEKLPLSLQRQGEEPGTGEGQGLPNSVVALASPQQTGASRVAGG